MKSWIDRQQKKTWLSRQLFVLGLALKYNGTLPRKLKFWHFARMLARKDVISFRIGRVADLYVKDWFDYKDATKDEKIWAYAHGFSSYKMAPWYGVTVENFRDYISDFDFYCPSNYNPQRDILAWFENKLNTYYLLSPFKEYMPKHYFYKYAGKVYSLGCQFRRLGSVEDVLALVENGPVAVKACYGGHGVGFVKLEMRDGAYYANDEHCPKKDIISTLEKLDNCIVTEFVRPHPKLQELCGEGTFAVMRVITVFDPKDGPQITCSAIRLGCKQAGITTDHEGTIYCGLTLDTGVAFKPLIRVADNKYVPCPRHPDTDRQLEGFALPSYDKLRELVLNVSSYLPMTPYLVMDIVPTEDGFALLEINSHGQVGNVEPFFPFGANRFNRKVFKLDQDRN